MNSYTKIAEYFEYLKTNFDASICIKDFSGFIPLDKELHRVLEPYLIHCHSFCLYVKKERECYFECLAMIPKMLKKSIELRDRFYGTCHAGLSEFVIPIINQNNVIGAITFGSFIDENSNIESRLNKLSQKHPSLSNDILHLKLSETTQCKIKNPEDVLLVLEIIAQFLAHSYDKFDVTNNQVLISKGEVKSEIDDVVDFCIQYIKDHLTEKIKIEDISEKCNYCVSYISRSFNKRIGMNINTYINKMRVEVSKNYLLTSNKSIADIAETVGFSDVSYYSKVFSNLLDLSPAEFRRRFR